MIVRCRPFAKVGSLMIRMVGLALALTALHIAPARAEPTTSAPGAVVYFHSPLDGARVTVDDDELGGVAERRVDHGMLDAGLAKAFGLTKS